jgi:hypothetical protein
MPGHAMRTDVLSRKWCAIFLVLLMALIAIGANGAHTDNVNITKISTSSDQQFSDAKLYQNISGRVAKGEGYYNAVAAEHRIHVYPLKPFVTVRLPAIAFGFAVFGTHGMQAIMLILICATLVAWFLFLRQFITSIVYLFSLVFAILISCSIYFMVPTIVVFHEIWAAVLIALMIGMHGRAPLWVSVMTTLAACMIRELAFPVLGLMAVFALYKKDWKEAAYWCGAAAVFLLYLGYHAYRVSQILTPNDLASTGWSGFGGWVFLTASLAKTTVLSLFAPGVTGATIVISVFGWLNVNAVKGLYVAAMLSGYFALMMVFARPDNLYWTLLFIPLIFTGAILGIIAIMRILSVVTKSAAAASLAAS